jgi:cytochrome c-type biogenesis protein CcmH
MGAGHATGSDLNPLVEKLAARLRDKTPEDGEGWVLLAHSYIEVGRFPDAVRAFEKAVKLVPPDAQLLADYADAQAMVNNRRFDGKPAELIKQALAVDPNNLKVLMLAGSEAFARKDYSHAITYWEKLLKLLPPDSDEAREFAMGVKEAKGLMSPGAPAEAKLDNLADFSAKENVPASTGASVSGVVSLSPALAAKVAPTDKLFIFARALNGPKMPLAIVEAQVKDLPFKFTLTDAMAMMPQLKLSGFPEIVVVARVSKSGNASPQSGDLQGGSSKVKAGEKNVRVSIDAVVP